MNLERARRILGISPEDDWISMKKKYRRLMGTYHPDAVGSERSEHIRRAQEINEAYHLLKKQLYLDSSGEERKKWQGIVNEKAYCERNIYLYYSMDIPEEHPYYQTARGKYMWDPDEEDFDLFLFSIRHALEELLEKTEEKRYGRRFSALSEEVVFEFQTRLFPCLAMQFIDPLKTLHKIAKPVKVDGKGREIYRFRAFLGSWKNDAFRNVIVHLKEGDSIYPKSFQENKIMVMDIQGRALDYLSLEDDQLYFCIIPLLGKKLAQMKLVVKEVEVKKKTRPFGAKVNLDFYVRLENGADQYEDSSLNRKIADLLRQYEEA